MKRGDSRTEGFVGFKEVAEVGGGVAVGCPERGALVVEAIMLGPLFVHGVDPAIKRVKAVVARHAGREDAVEHIDTACNGVEDVFRVADTHEVASFVFGQQRGGVLDNGVLHLGGFTDTDSTDGDSVKGEVGYVCRAFLAHIEVHSALDDSEDGLTLFTRGEVAMRPFVGALHGLVGFVSRARVRRALVEHHADIDAKLGLDLDRSLGSEEVLATVEVGFEGDALVGDLVGFAEGHHLVTTAVGEDRAFPGHEVVEAV